MAVGVLDPGFFMGSMSAAVGEKITRLTEYAEKAAAADHFSASGGARMQEGHPFPDADGQNQRGRGRFQRSGGLFISCLTHLPPVASAPAFQPGRHHLGGAGGAHRLCRSPRHRADHPSEVARGDSSGRNIWRNMASWTVSCPAGS